MPKRIIASDEKLGRFFRQIRGKTRLTSFYSPLYTCLEKPRLYLEFVFDKGGNESLLGLNKADSKNRKRASLLSSLFPSRTREVGQIYREKKVSLMLRIFGADVKRIHSM